MLEHLKANLSVSRFSFCRSRRRSRTSNCRPTSRAFHGRQDVAQHGVIDAVALNHPHMRIEHLITFGIRRRAKSCSQQIEHLADATGGSPESGRMTESAIAGEHLFFEAAAPHSSEQARKMSSESLTTATRPSDIGRACSRRRHFMFAAPSGDRAMLRGRDRMAGHRAIVIVAGHDQADDRVGPVKVDKMGRRRAELFRPTKRRENQSRAA